MCGLFLLKNPTRSTSGRYKNIACQLTAACIDPCLCSKLSLCIWPKCEKHEKFWKVTTWFEKCPRGDINFRNYLVQPKHQDAPATSPHPLLIPLTCTQFTCKCLESPLLGNIHRGHGMGDAVPSLAANTSTEGKLRFKDSYPSLSLKDPVSVVTIKTCIVRYISAIYANWTTLLFNKCLVQISLSDACKLIFMNVSNYSNCPLV